MSKAILTTHPVWILLLVVAAVTGGHGSVESAKHWRQYGESRLHKALSREVRREWQKLNNWLCLLFISSIELILG
jgi:hypothetical protein